MDFKKDNKGREICNRIFTLDWSYEVDECGNPHITGLDLNDIHFDDKYDFLFCLEKTNNQLKENEYIRIFVKDLSLLMSYLYFDLVAIFKEPELLGDFQYIYSHIMLSDLHKILDERIVEAKERYSTDSLYGIIESLMKTFNDNIATIPYSSTEYVRRELRKGSEKYYAGNRNKHFKLNKLALDMLQEEAQGGVVYVNPKYRGKLVKNVMCRDAFSEYPSMMLSQKYPIEDFRLLEKNEEIPNPAEYCIIMRVFFRYYKYRDGLPMIPLRNIRANSVDEPYQRSDKQDKVMEAKNIEVTLSYQELEYIKRHCDTDYIIAETVVAKNGPIPQYIADFINLSLAEKNKWKGIDEHKYKFAKRKLNSIFGIFFRLSNQYHFRYDIGCLTAMYGRIFLAYHFDVISSFTTVLYTDTDSIYYIANDKVEYFYDNIYKFKNGFCSFVIEHTDVEFKMLGAKNYCIRENGETIYKVAGLVKDDTILPSIEDYNDDYIFINGCKTLVRTKEGFYIKSIDRKACAEITIIGELS